MRLATKHSAQRLDAACKRALALRAYSYQSVASILKNRLENEPLLADQGSTARLIHPNIRGEGYYQ
jgi:hypothetical protein